jgi:hypothetical protein
MTQGLRQRNQTANEKNELGLMYKIWDGYFTYQIKTYKVIITDIQRLKFLARKEIQRVKVTHSGTKYTS